MYITLVVNNNVVMTADENDNELILVGKGLGFQAKKGDKVQEDKIQKRFYLQDENLFERFKNIINELSADELLITSEIISFAENQLNQKFNESIYVALSDHIHFMIERYHRGEILTNAFLWDLQKYYSAELNVAKYAVDLLNEKFSMNLGEDEAGFIAFHFINASDNSQKDLDLKKLTDLINSIVSIVSYSLNVPIDSTTTNGYRFINHVKYFAQRVFTKKSNNNSTTSDDDLYEIVKNKYKDSYQIMKKIEKLLIVEYNYPLDNNEKLYFIIHIHRLENE